MCVSLSGVRRSSPAFSPQFLLAGSASPWAGRTPAGFQAGQSRRCFVFPALRWFPFMSTPGARRRFLLRLVVGVAGTVSHGRYQSPACSPLSSLSADFLEEAVRASSPSRQATGRQKGLLSVCAPGCPWNKARGGEGHLTSHPTVGTWWAGLSKGERSLRCGRSICGPKGPLSPVDVLRQGGR